MELTTILLEDKEYVIIDTIVINNENYVYLSSIEDATSFCIYKLVNEDKIKKLDSEEEYKNALNAFYEKYQNAFND